MTVTSDVEDSYPAATELEDESAAPTSSSGWLRVGVPVVSVVVGLVVWQLVALIVNNGLFLVGPLETAEGIGKMWSQYHLALDLEVSGQEALYGFVIGSIAGVIFGGLMAKSRLAERILAPYVSGFYATPIIALAPIVILWFGLGIWSKVLVVVSLVIFPQIINTHAGISNVSPNLRELARSYGGSAFTVFRRIDMPASLPYVLAGLRLGVGRALIGVIVGELFGARTGLGLAIFNAQQEFNMRVVFAGTALFAIAGIVFTYCLAYIEQRATPWVDRSV